MKEVFETIYETNRWGSRESTSGTGSTLEQTRVTRQRLPSLLERYKIKSLLDIPCGDFHWMSHVSLNEIGYIGGDIVQAIVHRNRTEHDHDFRVLDIISSKLPESDLVITRDCLVHLSDANVFASIVNIKASGSKYLLTTTFPGRENSDIQTGEWRAIDLQAGPFHFPIPIEIINEGCTEFGGIYSDKSLALFDVSQLPDY